MEFEEGGGLSRVYIYHTVYSYEQTNRARRLSLAMAEGAHDAICRSVSSPRYRIYNVQYIPV